MTQEDKKLLIADLSARLPYGVKVQIIAHNTVKYLIVTELSLDYNGWVRGYMALEDGRDAENSLHFEEIKPYLRPMSSMTEEELTQYKCMNDALDENYEVHIDNAYPAFDFLNSHHFDYRCLINKGIALEAPKGMYEQDDEITTFYKHFIFKTK